MKSKFNPKKAIALVGALVILVVGGYFLGQYLTGEKEDGAAAAAVVSPIPSPSPSLDTIYHLEIDRLPDGIVGVDTTPETEAEDNGQDIPSPLPATPTSGSNGSSGGSTSAAPSPGSGTTSTTPPASTPVPPANSGNGSGSTPPAGSTNSSGQFYDPVFGWVTPTGGTGETVGGDGDINKQVGTMG